MREWYESFLINVAKKILIDRNVSRSRVTSRADNNDMWYMGEKLEGIELRIKTRYKDV